METRLAPAFTFADQGLAERAYYQMRAERGDRGRMVARLGMRIHRLRMTLKKRAATKEMQLAAAELAEVDRMLSGRPALNNCQTRVEKLITLLRCAEATDPKGELANAFADAEELRRALAAALEGRQ